MPIKCLPNSFQERKNLLEEVDDVFRSIFKSDEMV